MQTKACKHAVDNQLMGKSGSEEEFPPSHRAFNLAAAATAV